MQRNLAGKLLTNRIEKNRQRLLHHVKGHIGSKVAGSVHALTASGAGTAPTSPVGAGCATGGADIRGATTLGTPGRVIGPLRPPCLGRAGAVYRHRRRDETKQQQEDAQVKNRLRHT